MTRQTFIPAKTSAREMQSAARWGKSRVCDPGKRSHRWRCRSSLCAVAVIAGCTAGSPVAPATVRVTVDAEVELGDISPLIRGLSGDADREYMAEAGITLNSWGGNPSSRYNYELGNAWNAGADWYYRNGNYGQSGDVADGFISATVEAGAVVRLAVPTLGWVAKNDDLDTCSFPGEDGTCGDAGGASCSNPGAVADPRLANVPSTSTSVRAWVDRLMERHGPGIRFVALDNEPELWGVTHYDVHPTCATYEEIRDTYLEYATALRDVAPDAALSGPVVCCWYSFMNVAPGPSEGTFREFLPWFLEEVRKHDETYGQRTLDVVDVHYYPQSDVYNDRTDDETAARRLRSTRSLYDPYYVDESWIGQPIFLIPRLLTTIEAEYPGTPLAISEWNFGADTTMNGALAIADVLGIYGREGVHAAAYWRSPPKGSAGYYAFKMHGNYDDDGHAFEGTAVWARSPDVDRLSVFAAVDGDGRLQIMLLNKEPQKTVSAAVSIDGYRVSREAVAYRYSEGVPDRIERERIDISPTSVDVSLPPYSVTVIVTTRE
jgi:hypothetical protein